MTDTTHPTILADIKARIAHYESELLPHLRAEAVKVETAIAHLKKLVEELEAKL